MKTNIIALLSGLLFGLGLAVSNMLNPARVLSFLDIFGQWDPTLAFVMGGALMLTIPGFFLILKKPRPLFSSRFDLPAKQTIDRQLIIGAVLFGLGWGLAGLCPGPAIAALVSLDKNILLFMVLMSASWWATDKVLSP